MSLLLQLALLFAKLSLLAVGGASATVPEMTRQTVDIHHWLTPAQFSQLYAISNSAPGPNVLISTILGAHVAGVAGGIVATLAMIIPSCTLAVLVSRQLERHAAARWRRVLQAALLPITAGLILAAAIVLARQADRGWLTTAITLACATAAYHTRLHPLLLLGIGAALGLFFL
jgi:chromate transporter